MDYIASMRGKMIAFAILQILLLQVHSAVAGEYCPYYDSILSNGNRYCEEGCCGSSSSDVCCDVVGVGVIVGSVVGGLVGLGVFIGIIVCCCCACARSGGQRPGVVFQPMNTNSQTIVMNSTSVAQGMSTSPGPPYGHAVNPYGSAQAGYVQFTNVPQEHPPPYASKY